MKIPKFIGKEEVVLKIKAVIFGVLLVTGFVFVNCEANIDKNVSVSEFSVAARGSAEGINLYFSNIPENTVSLFISLRDNTINDHLTTYTNISGNELEQVKNTGLFVCPFVKNGHEYEIFIVYFTGNEDDIKPVFITAAANGGIYLSNKPAIFVKEIENSIILSEKPILSDAEKYSHEQLLMYYIIFYNAEDGMVEYVANYSDDLIFDYSQKLNEILDNNLQINDLAVFSYVDYHLKHENIFWTIQLGRTGEN